VGQPSRGSVEACRNALPSRRHHAPATSPHPKPYTTHPRTHLHLFAFMGYMLVLKRSAISISSYNTSERRSLISRASYRTNSTLPSAPAMPPSDFPTQAFSSSADFAAFLEREHTTAPGIFVKLAKKSSGIPSVSAAEAVKVALCYGWIDGRANSIDDTWWTVRYTPRRAKSIWSQKNVGTIPRLIEDGRMRPAGLAAAASAKADGRWDRAYAGSATIAVPEDLKTALAKVPSAKALWESLNKSERYTALWKIETASVTARAKRVEAVVQMLAASQRPGSATETAAQEATSKRNASVQKRSPKLRSSNQTPSLRTGLRQ
jgi:uncharacterized protein YdeI (YjbR/CyaY-like superfamily)